MSTRLEASAKYRSDVNVWVDEAIWGHRLYNDQTPWLVFLEFLAIFRSRDAEGKALKENKETPRKKKDHRRQPVIFLSCLFSLTGLFAISCFFGRRFSEVL